MNSIKLSRRAALAAGVVLIAASLPAVAQGTGPQMHVLKDPNCGCCTAWIEIVEAAGFRVTTEFSAGAALIRLSLIHI